MTSTSPKNITKPIPRGPPLLPTCSPHFFVLFQPFFGYFSVIFLLFNAIFSIFVHFINVIYWYLIINPALAHNFVHYTIMICIRNKYWSYLECFLCLFFIAHIFEISAISFIIVLSRHRCTIVRFGKITI